jgi:CBS domain-containing protein
MPSSLAQNLRANRVGSLRLREICRVGLVTSIQDVVQAMVRGRAGCALVMDGHALVGIFTEHDFLKRVVARSIDPSRPVHEVMTTDPKTIDQQATVLAAIELMESGGYRHLPVVGEAGKPIGVVSAGDIVRYLVDFLPSRKQDLPSSAQPQLAHDRA